MHLLFVVDPLDTFKTYKDTTFAMMREAQRRGHQIWACEPSDLVWRSGQQVQARAQHIRLTGQPEAWYESLAQEMRELHRFDRVLMRKDPPFDSEYFYATHLLTQAEREGARVYNRPSALREHPEKLAILEFPQFLSPTLVTRDAAQIRAFHAEHGDIILKPLYGNGGAGVFRLGEGDQNFSSLLELFTQTFREPFIAQKYLPDVRKGDKRIILVDGKAAGAINRVPAVNENRSNMHVGGKAEPTHMTRREHDICEAIGPDLKDRGLIFVGIDVIGDYLTEINVTSPTGLQQINRFDGVSLEAQIWDAIEARRR